MTKELSDTKRKPKAFVYGVLQHILSYESCAH